MHHFFLESRPHGFSRFCAVDNDCGNNLKSAGNHDQLSYQDVAGVTINVKTTLLGSIGVCELAKSFHESADVAG
jgi:hypothetical protein